jgi:hypothetical protein
MKPSYIVFLVFCAGSLFVHTSCKRLLETEKNTPAFDKYKIAQIKYTSDSMPYTEAGEYDKMFYFNSAGEPLKAIAKNLQTGNSNQAFTYDAKGRLSSLVLFFGDEASSLYAAPQFNNTFVAHLYSHDPSGNIAADTFYITDGLPIGGGGFLYSVTNFYYDSYSRLISSVEKDKYGNISENKYQYDANGNLKGYTYDNTLNVKRLSNVMMFLNKDYSLNNRLKSSADSSESYSYTYNGNKLPVKIKGLPMMPSEFGPYAGENEITYGLR